MILFAPLLRPLLPRIVSAVPRLHFSKVASPQAFFARQQPTASKHINIQNRSLSDKWHQPSVSRVRPLHSRPPWQHQSLYRCLHSQASQRSQGPQRHRPQRRRAFDPEEAANAKPLITPELIFYYLKHSNALALGVLGAGVVVYIVVTHIEEVPISGRRRINFFGPESMAGQGRVAYQSILRESQSRLLAHWDPRVRLVRRVMDRLVSGNALDAADWEINVIESSGESKARIACLILKVCRSERLCSTRRESIRIYRHFSLLKGR